MAQALGLGALDYTAAVFRLKLLNRPSDEDDSPEHLLKTMNIDSK